MTIQVYNSCSCPVRLRINNEKCVDVMPKRTAEIKNIVCDNFKISVENVFGSSRKYSLQGTTQGRYLTGGVPPVRFSM